MVSNVALQSSRGSEALRPDPSITTSRRSGRLKSEPGSLPPKSGLLETMIELRALLGDQVGGRPPTRELSCNCIEVSAGKLVPKHGGIDPVVYVCVVSGGGGGVC